MPLFPKAATHPTEVALSDGTRHICWAELEDRVTRLANSLRDDHGLGLDSHIALLMHNRTEAIEGMLAGIAAGAWVTPINWHLTPEEIAYVLGDSGAQLVLSDEAHESIARSHAGGTVVRVGEELDGMLASASDAPVDPGAPSGGNMIYTSGTTGYPKGVQRARPATLADSIAGQRAYADSIALDGSGAHLVTGPLYHAAPLMMAIYDMHNGAPVLVMPRWDEREFLRSVDEQNVRHTHLVPTMLVRLLRLPEEERAASLRPNLNVVLHGAAPISPRVKHEVIDWWGPILLEYWGGSEGGVNTLIDSEDWLAHPGSVGRCLPPFEVFATDADGTRLPADEVGTLYCRDSRFDEPFRYHDDEAKTASAYLEPGVFTLGDMGWIDAEGYVHLADRKSNMIISGGVNIYPAEIEQVLIGHPAVADVGVFGIPDDEWGEAVKAAIEVAEGFEASDELATTILDYAREHLAKYKLPRTVDFEDELPRSSAGKLYVRRLRDKYWEGRDKRI